MDYGLKDKKIGRKWIENAKLTVSGKFGKNAGERTHRRHTSAAVRRSAVGPTTDTWRPRAGETHQACATGLDRVRTGAPHANRTARDRSDLSEPTRLDPRLHRKKRMGTRAQNPRVVYPPERVSRACRRVRDCFPSVRPPFACFFAPISTLILFLCKLGPIKEIPEFLEPFPANNSSLGRHASTKQPFGFPRAVLVGTARNKHACYHL